MSYIGGTEIILISSLLFLTVLSYFSSKKNPKWIVVDIPLFLVLFLTMYKNIKWITVAILLIVFISTFVFIYWASRETQKTLRLFIFGVSILFAWFIFVFTHEKPALMQGAATLILVIITSFYAYLIYESNENMQKREEKRRKEKREDLRNLIKAELEHNMSYVREIKKQIENIKLVISKKLKTYSLEDYTPPRDKIYNAVLNELGALNRYEIHVSSDIYDLVNALRRKYDDLRAAAKINKHVDSKKLNDFVEYGMHCTDKLEKLWTMLSDFFGDRDYKRLEDRYNDFIETL